MKKKFWVVKKSLIHLWFKEFVPEIVAPNSNDFSEVSLLFKYKGYDYGRDSIINLDNFMNDDRYVFMGNYNQSKILAKLLRKS